MGKTTMCRLLLNRLPERVDVALILNPVLTPEELLDVVFDELGVAHGAEAPTPTGLGDVLSRRQAAGPGERRTVVIVDDAHSLGLDVLEHLSRLSSLERDGKKLLQVILIGEPGLIELLSRGAADGPRHPRRAISCCPSRRTRRVRTCVTGSRSPAAVATSSTWTRCEMCIACPPACRVSSTPSAPGRCSSPSPSGVKASTSRPCARLRVPRWLRPAPVDRVPRGSSADRAGDDSAGTGPIAGGARAAAALALARERRASSQRGGDRRCLPRSALPDVSYRRRPARRAEAPARIEPPTAPLAPPVDDPPRTPQTADAAETPAPPPALATRPERPRRSPAHAAGSDRGSVRPPRRRASRRGSDVGGSARRPGRRRH